jgi:hypothetical protein
MCKRTIGLCFDQSVTVRACARSAGSLVYEMRPQVGLTVALERAADAHHALEAGEVIGKAVLVVRSE